MPPLRESVDVGPGRVASFEAIGRGPPLFYFVGGPGFSAALLRDQAELLSDRLAVHLIDPHGSGGSTAPSDPSHYDPAGHAYFYDEVRRALSIESAVIMGESFGALVALSYAALFPDATRVCISVSGRVVGSEVESEEAAAEMQTFLQRHSRQPWYPSARKTWDEWTDRILATDDPHEADTMMAEILPLYTADPDRPAVQKMIEQFRREMQCDLVAAKVWESGLWQRIDVRPLLSDIKCPTLVLVGELDMICGPAQGRVIADAVTDAEMVTIAGSGHFVGVEQPERFREEIIRFAAP
ncbi:MAG: alpha/beta fold hydrolase [Solirubrobacteraceae bacterium]